MNKISLALSSFAIVLSFFALWKLSAGPGVNLRKEPISKAIVADTLVFVNARSLDIPEKLTFAGEPVPLHIPDVRERLDRELHINAYWHNNTIFLIKRAHRWLPQIEGVLERKGVPKDFKYIAVIESSLQNAISPANAVGFWQFVKGTGKEYGLEISREVDERYDPIKSTEAAADYLLNAYKKFGNWTSVAASYNRGMNGFNRAVKNQRVDSYYDLYMNSETARYLFRVIACREILENPAKYGFKIKNEHLYNPELVKKVEVSQSIPDLVGWSLEQGINYKLLKRHNPWLREEHLTVRGKTYEIAIPIEDNALNN